jgi:hypothetical protein
MCDGWPAGPAPSRFYSTPIKADADGEHKHRPTIHTGRECAVEAGLEDAAMKEEFDADHRSMMMWTLAFGHHEDRTPTHGYEATCEAAMAAFAKSWRCFTTLDVVAMAQAASQASYG